MRRVFLDTSYLFPFFNLNTDIAKLEDSYDEILNKNRYFYSDLSLIEIKWQMIRLEKRSGNKPAYQSLYCSSLDSIQNDDRLTVISFADTNVNNIADKIRNLGHNDYFDSIIGAASLWHSDILVTEDSSLIKLINQLNEAEKINDKFTAYNWKEYCSLIN